MKIAYSHLQKYFSNKPSIGDLSDKLFQLGHEHEIQDGIFDMEFTPNRGDCLSLNGLSRDLNIFFDKILENKIYTGSIESLDLEFKNNINHISASYQEAILDCLFNALENVTTNYNDVNDFYISGGVAANSRLRVKAKSFEEKFNKKIILPKLEYCTDNAAMIAMASYQKMMNGQKSDYDLAPSPNLKL